MLPWYIVLYLPWLPIKNFPVMARCPQPVPRCGLEFNGTRGLSLYPTFKMAAPHPGCFPVASPEMFESKMSPDCVKVRSGAQWSARIEPIPVELLLDVGPLPPDGSGKHDPRPVATWRWNAPLLYPFNWTNDRQQQRGSRQLNTSQLQMYYYPKMCVTVR